MLEYLSQLQARLPASAKPSLGPDATGVGWIYQYALVDRTGQHDLAQLRALQDWFLKFELKTLPNVAEVATIGGQVKQYQVQLDPLAMASRGITQAQVADAVGKANQETGGSVLNLGESEYMVRASGYLKTLDDFRAIPLRLDRNHVPVTLGDVATIQLGPDLRRGISELDGEGEAVGGGRVGADGDERGRGAGVAAVHVCGQRGWWVGGCFVGGWVGGWVVWWLAEYMAGTRVISVLAGTGGPGGRSGVAGYMRGYAYARWVCAAVCWLAGGRLGGGRVEGSIEWRARSSGWALII